MPDRPPPFGPARPIRSEASGPEDREPVRSFAPDGPGRDGGRPRPHDPTEADGSAGEDDYTPMRQSRSTGLMDEDLGAKTGNYVFTFGFPGSGKTTLYSYLMRYAMQVGPYKTEPIQRMQASGAVNYDVNRLVQQWMREWRSGRFPKSTQRGEDQIKELSFHVQPLQGVRTPLEFSFLEVSGEDLQTVMPGERSDPFLPRVIAEILRNRRISIILMLVVHPDVDRNDELFMNFLNYVDSSVDADLRSRASLAIVVADPGRALRYLKDKRAGYEGAMELRGDLVEDFVEEFAPTTYRIYTEWPNPKRKVIARLHLGRIGERGGVPVIDDYSPDSTRNLFEWIYYQFIGRYPGLTRWQRFLRWVRKP